MSYQKPFETDLKTTESLRRFQVKETQRSSRHLNGKHCFSFCLLLRLLFLFLFSFLPFFYPCYSIMQHDSHLF